MKSFISYVLLASMLFIAVPPAKAHASLSSQLSNLTRKIERTVDDWTYSGFCAHTTYITSIAYMKDSIIAALRALSIQNKSWLATTILVLSATHQMVVGATIWNGVE